VTCLSCCRFTPVANLPRAPWQLLHSTGSVPGVSSPTTSLLRRAVCTCRCTRPAIHRDVPARLAVSVLSPPSREHACGRWMTRAVHESDPTERAGAQGEADAPVRPARRFDSVHPASFPGVSAILLRSRSFPCAPRDSSPAAMPRATPARMMRGQAQRLQVNAVRPQLSRLGATIRRAVASLPGQFASLTRCAR
jgi:hypothetical protein